MTLMTMSIVFGLLFGIFLAYLILDDLSSGNWRLLVLCSCLPSVIGCVKIYITIHFIKFFFF